MSYKINLDSIPQCLECGQLMQFGRTDRKFCCEKCKNDFNNRKNKDSRNLKIRILNAIEKNYSILDKLVKLNVSSIDIPEILMMGYKPGFITSHHKVRTHNEYWCYDIKYYQSANRIFSIERVVPNSKKQS